MIVRKVGWNSLRCAEILSCDYVYDLSGDYTQFLIQLHYPLMDSFENGVN